VEIYENLAAQDKAMADRITSDPIPYSQILYACTKKEIGVGGIAVG